MSATMLKFLYLSVCWILASLWSLLLLLAQFHRWKSWSSEMLSNLPKVTHITMSRIALKKKKLSGTTPCSLNPWWYWLHIFSLKGRRLLGEMAWIFQHFFFDSFYKYGKPLHWALLTTLINRSMSVHNGGETWMQPF